jgi:hypothetical protein
VDKLRLPLHRRLIALSFAVVMSSLDYLGTLSFLTDALDIKVSYTPMGHGWIYLLDV